MKYKKSQSRIHIGVDKVVDQRFASAQAKWEREMGGGRLGVGEGKKMKMI